MKVEIDYTNWRGIRARRVVLPEKILFGQNEWHPEPGWLLQAVDLKTGETRTFSLKNIHAWVEKS